MLIVGGRAPVLVNEKLIPKMKSGSVIVDVSIDQGGCCATSRPTTHRDPTYIVDGVVHYCVTNMPGAVGRTSSHALCNATLPYCREIARHGLDKWTKLSPGRAAAVNMRGGKLVNEAVSAAFPDLPRA